uniref:Immunoglobulin V-set domain-containing protein n=1 Tax=Poecilia reticulata TaxID=8081 RepID=A0A3P9NEE5_POERE
MKNSVLIAAVLYSFCWTSGSVSGSEILTVHPGEDVRLQSANMFQDGSVTFWLRVINQTTTSCIAVINGVSTTIDHCEGFDSGSFEMTVNVSNVTLIIKRVNISDTGIYICGRYHSANLKLTVQHLHVIEKPNNMMLFVIPGSGIVVLLIIVIVLIIQVMKIQTGNSQKSIT